MMSKETLINSVNERKHEAHGTQQPRHINMIGEDMRAPRNEVIRSCSQFQRFLNIRSTLLPSVALDTARKIAQRR
ncbi:MAG: hypothetical protein DU480_10200 [Nitrosomonas sp.]|uniref:hypothetical protein n=1 Tax=Nitrosomonas sp. TaxID=42353 RepID=UPI0032ECF45F